VRRLRLFLLASGFLVAAAALAAGLLVGRLFERQILAQEETQTAEMVLSQARQHLAPEDFDGPDDDAELRNFLKGLPGVFRVKVFDRQGRIVWSNEPRLIGMVFADNRYLQAALAGRVTTVLSAPERPEHIFERDRPYVTEVYTPITFAAGAEPVGVIETYKDSTGLVLGIRGTQRWAWAAAGAIGLVVYLGLAAVAWTASASEARAIRRLADQNEELRQLQRFTRSVLQPLDRPRLAGSIVESAVAALPLRAAALHRVATGSDDAALLAAWPPGTRLDAPPEVVDDTLVARRPLIRGRLLATQLRTPNGTPHLFLGELEASAPLVMPALPTLGIMLDQAAVALGNVELFTGIREAHERLSAILAGIADRMVIVDREMRIVWMNAVAEGDAGSGVGRPCFEVLGAGAEACENCPAVRTFVGGKMERGVRTVRGPDGRTRHLAPLHDDAGEAYQVLEVARDVTELVEMEERVKQANQALLAAQARLVEKERLAAVGQVVVGLHHAILNPLTGVLGVLQVLKESAGEAAERRELIAAAEAELHKIERLVRTLPDLQHADPAPYVGATTMLDLRG
jgi:PAS domain-containing protein